jgi:hypothetical protein
MKGLCSLLLAVLLYAVSGVVVAQTCPVTYTIVNSWPGGFQAGITITNTGTTAINGWTLEWMFPGAQQISQLWGGSVSSQGQTVTVTSLSWDATIPAGGSMNSVGFTATGTAATPTAFVLNGVACGSGGGGGSPPPAPTGLTATPGNDAVTLSWTASAGAVSYNVERSTTSGGPYTTVGTPTTTDFTDTSVTNGVTYFYVVDAADLAGTSPNSAQVSATPSGSVPNVTITINPTNTQHISPWIYGINAGTIPNLPHVTITRLGGNRWTAYNWTTNASNAGSDFNYESDNFLSSSTVAGEAVRPTIASDIAGGTATLMTVQLQGLVSADENGPVSIANPPDLTRFDAVVDQKSTVSAAPFTTAPLTSGPVFMDEFAWAMDQKFPGVGMFGGTTATPTFVDLDNEPELWNTTHLEVQGATAVTPQAYISKTLSLTEALKKQFPSMTIFGPVHYGFLGIYNWQTQLSATPTGTNWFTDMYLQALSTASATFGRPLVDVYDFHWYPEDYDSNSLRVTSMTSSTLTDAQMQLVVQAPRNLWDSTFTDPGNSNPWVNQVLGNTPIQILPRLKAKIASEFPSMKLSISEYEAGGFNNIAGTVAQADELGVFATQGLFAAMFWPPGGTFDYSLAGFRAYRDFDGANSNFGDTLLQSTSSNVQNVVVYASKDSTNPNRVVFVAINRASSAQLTAINGAPLSGTAHMYQITAATAEGQSPVTPIAIGQMAVSGSSLALTLPAYSVTTIDVH